MIKSKISIVTGGARSGKSSYASELAKESNLDVIYLATAQIKDEEMKNRIEIHRSSRPASWKTIEEPINVIGAVSKEEIKNRCVIVDCLTLYVTNLILADYTDEMIFERARQVASFFKREVLFPIFVTNEVGSGIVPENHLARRFRDVSGMVNQIFSRYSDTVYLVACGIPVKIKG